MVERPNTLAGLIEKRQEIAGKIEHTQKVLNDLTIDLDHIDHCIRMFDPDGEVDLGKPKQFPPRDASAKGEMQRFVLGALRAATEPITSYDIALEVVKGRGLNVHDRRTVSLTRKRVGAALWKLRDKEIVRDVGLVGSYKGWELVD